MAVRVTIVGEAKSGAFTIHEEILGLDETMAALEVFGENAKHELIGALYREGERIKAESRLECPVAPHGGHLRDSAHVEIVGDGVIVGYGGVAIPYALRQHEELTYRHTVGKAKYLEDPYKRHASDMDTRIAEELRNLATFRGL